MRERERVEKNTEREKNTYSTKSSESSKFAESFSEPAPKNTEI